MQKPSPRLVSALICLALTSQVVHAQVSVTDRKVLKQSQKHAGPHVTPTATGSQSLIDSGGMKYFINTNITFSTTSSASGAMSEASYTHAVSADTMNGGVTNSTLNDSFDGYNTMCMSLNNTVASCRTGNANFIIYNMNGPATVDATCPSNRQVVFPVKTAGNIQMQRKVFVPANDTFARHLNYFTNTGGSPQTVTMMVANNLGSDSNTRVTGSSTFPSTSTATTWISSFQNWSGTKSSDPRLGFALAQAGAATTLAGLNFVDGDDNPFWGYTFIVQPGQTAVIANFVTPQPTRALSQSKATALAGGTNPNQWSCMTAAERANTRNFVAAVPAAIPVIDQAGLIALVLSMLGMGLYFRKRRNELS